MLFMAYLYLPQVSTAQTEQGDATPMSEMMGIAFRYPEKQFSGR